MRPLPPGSHSPCPGPKIWLVACEWNSSPSQPLESTFVLNTTCATVRGGRGVRPSWVTSGRSLDGPDLPFPQQENGGGCEGRIKCLARAGDVSAQQTGQIGVSACMSHICASLAVCVCVRARTHGSRRIINKLSIVVISGCKKISTTDFRSVSLCFPVF